MVLISERQYLVDRLLSMKKSDLLEFSNYLGAVAKGKVRDIVSTLADKPGAKEKLDKFIKCKYTLVVRDRQSRITDNDLLTELSKVDNYKWGVVQGELDRKIQSDYVRQFVRYDRLVSAVKGSLHDEVTKYVICSWYNHWTTVLIEDHVFAHSNVVPALRRNVKGLDLFFDGQPFDLKITYLPRGYDPQYAVSRPSELVKWLYENQGAQRFGADNRLFIVLLDLEHPEESWKLKRRVDVLFPAIDSFLNDESVGDDDEVIFTFKKSTYTTHAKLLFVTPSSPMS